MIVKQEEPVKSVKGYLVLKSKIENQRSKIQTKNEKINSLLASVFFAFPSLAKEDNSREIEENLVLFEFEYIDPDGDGIYKAEIQAPVVEAEYEIITLMDLKDPKLGRKEIRLIAVVEPQGYIYEKIVKKN